jgi:hypothetical protein
LLEIAHFAPEEKPTDTKYPVEPFQQIEGASNAAPSAAAYAGFAVQLIPSLLVAHVGTPVLL